MTAIDDLLETDFSALSQDRVAYRPIYHQKEYRTDGHLFGTVLAYHILQTIRFKLRQQGITFSWGTIR